MKSFLITFILTLPLLPSATPTTHRRILHQPLFPANSTTPPPPPASGSPTSDNPFFHETPTQQTPDQPPPPPPPQPQPESPATHPVTPAPANKSGKKLAVVVSVGIVTLGMLSGLAFFVYKHKSKQHIESVNDTEDLPPARLLYVGTDSVNGSPYNNNINNNNNKLNSVKTSDRYRPSPDLQPLPPLSKLPVSETEEEIHDFYTPHGSTASTDEGYSVRGLNIKRIHRNVSSPNSKRSSPRSRLSVCSSPDSASENPHSTISPVKQSQTTSTSPAAKVIPKIVKPASSQYISDDDLQADDGLKPKMKPPRP